VDVCVCVFVCVCVCLCVLLHKSEVSHQINKYAER
jgi:preprotein translocase subunit SecG